jgi:hypothetical protein
VLFVGLFPLLGCWSNGLNCTFEESKSVRVMDLIFFTYAVFFFVFVFTLPTFGGLFFLCLSVDSCAIAYTFSVL